jgi:non-homologous end joining protein Ku
MRPIWSGSISFGLVSVPVRMYSATESKELRFNFLDRRDMSPIGYEKVSKEAGEVVDLMAALRESVERTQKQQKRATGRKPAKKAS